MLRHGDQAHDISQNMVFFLPSQLSPHTQYQHEIIPTLNQSAKRNIIFCEVLFYIWYRRTIFSFRKRIWQLYSFSFFVRYYENYQNTINYLLLKTLTLTNVRTRVFRDIRDNLLMLPSIRTGKLSVNNRLFSYFISSSNPNYPILNSLHSVQRIDQLQCVCRITYDLLSCFDDFI